MLHPRKCSFRKFAAASSSRAVTSASSIQSACGPAPARNWLPPRPARVPSPAAKNAHAPACRRPHHRHGHAHPARYGRQHMAGPLQHRLRPRDPGKARIDLRLQMQPLRLHMPAAPPSSRGPLRSLSRSTYIRNARAVGTRPAEVCGCSSNPSLASSAISLRTVAELSPAACLPPSRRTRAIVPAIVPEPTGSPVSM
jgi:hypothetical protein